MIKIKKEDIKEYFGQNIQIILKNNFIYNGAIKELRESCLTFIDRNDDKILIDFTEIALIKPLRNGLIIKGGRNVG